MHRQTPPQKIKYPAPKVNSATFEEPWSNGTMPPSYLVPRGVGDFTSSRQRDRILWFTSSERCLSAPLYLYNTHPVCLHRPIHRARRFASWRNYNLITFLQLIPAVSHLSPGSKGHVPTALPSSPPTPLSARPISRWWAEGMVPSKCHPGFPGKGRREGCCSWNVEPTPSGLPTQIREGWMLLKAYGTVEETAS